MINVVGLTEDSKIYIKNSTGKIIIDPLNMNGIIGCIKDVMQVSEFKCEVQEDKKEEN